MKKFGIQVVALVILIFVATIVVFKTNLGIVNVGNQTSNQPGQIKALKIKDTTINVEVADTDAKRAQGLGGRDSIASDSGMLFVFGNEGKYQFWMKGMKFGLDFIWIAGDKVVDILPNISAPPPNQLDSTLDIYGSNTPVDKVLEVNSGFASSHNINVGDSIQYIMSQ
jgi:uncharacterized protein